MVQACKPQTLAQSFAPADFDMQLELVFNPFNGLHYTCFVIPKNQIILGAPAADDARIATPEDVLLYIAARAEHLAWRLGRDP